MHPLGPTRERVAQGSQILQYGAMAFFAFGDRALPAVGMRVPPWYAQVARNRIGFIMAAFFIGNMVVANMAKTGAFEVYHNGRLVWSKLQSGQTPDVGRILSAVGRAVGSG